MDHLKITSGFWYAASPYSKFPHGIDAAARGVARIAGELLKIGVPVFSPVAHSHPIAKEASIDPYSHDIWMPVDLAFSTAAHGMLIIEMSGWEESKGIAIEAKHFMAAGKPVEHLTSHEILKLIPERMYF